MGRPKDPSRRCQWCQRGRERFRLHSLLPCPLCGGHRVKPPVVSKGLWGPVRTSLSSTALGQITFRGQTWQQASTRVRGGTPSARGGVAVEVSASGFTPSGGRALGVVATRIAAASQPVRRALPQLLPDGLGPDRHLRAAHGVAHPFYRPDGATSSDSIRTQVRRAGRSRGDHPERVHARAA